MISLTVALTLLNGALAPVAPTPGGTAPAAAAGYDVAAAPGPLSLDARLGDRFLFVKLGDSVAHVFPIAVGKSDHPTPTGSFSIRRIIWNPRWVPPDSPWARGKKATPPGDPKNPMRVAKIFFREPTYYIHGTNQLSSVGGEASHGCIRMLPDDVAHLAQWLMERGGQPRPASWYQRVRRAVTREHVVQLSNPIRLVISE